jgi:hypothetical protein
MTIRGNRLFLVLYLSPKASQPGHQSNSQMIRYYPPLVGAVYLELSSPNVENDTPTARRGATHVPARFRDIASVRLSDPILIPPAK